MKITALMTPLCALALSACASPSCPPAVSPLEYSPPEIPALELTPRTPNLTQRQRQILTPSPVRETAASET